jgi:hypothetical protein
VLNGISERENTTLRLCLITDIRVLLTHTNHDTISIVSGHHPIDGQLIGEDLPMVTGTTDNGGCAATVSIRIVEMAV